MSAVAPRKRRGAAPPCLIAPILTPLLVALLSACAPGSVPEPSTEADDLGAASAPLQIATQQELAPGALFNGDLFGSAVALSGDTALVGASWANLVVNGEEVEDAGAAYVFVDSGAWKKRAKLAAQEPNPWAFFGASVALAGETALVGAPGALAKGGGSGAVFAYQRGGADTWTEQSALRAPDGGELDAFGTSVALTDARAFVGAYRHESERGAVYIFSRTGSPWQIEQKLAPDPGRGSASFGLALAVAGDTLVVSAPSEHEDGVRTGAVYIFTREGAGWAREARLTPPREAGPISFGRSVAISGDTVVIGAIGADLFGPDAGAVYVSRRSEGEWTRPEPIGASDPKPGDKLGTSVALDGDMMAAGARNEDDGVKHDTGAVYVFGRRGDAWEEEIKLTLPGAASYDYFGHRVAVEDGEEGRTVLATASFANTWTSDSGAAYVFRLLLEDGRPCSEHGQCHSGICVEGVCCDKPCSGESLSCAEGKCVYTPAQGGAGGGSGGDNASGGGSGGAGGGAGTSSLTVGLPAADGPVEQRSYYSCQSSPGEPGAGALAAAAAAWLTSRRRRRRVA